MNLRKRWFGLVAGALTVLLPLAAFTDTTRVPGYAAGSVAVGVTTITSGTDGRVWYNNGGLVGESADFFFDDTTNAKFLRLGSGTGPGAIRLLEGSGGGTNYGVLTVPAALGGNRTYTFPDTDVAVIAGSAASLTSGRCVASTTNGLLVDNAGCTLVDDEMVLGTLTANTQITVAASASLSIGSLGTLIGLTAMTPDAPALLTATTSESWHIFQSGDAAANMGNGRAGAVAASAPSLILHSSDQVTTEYLHLNTDTTGAAHIQSDQAEITIGGFKQNITESSAVTLARVTLPSAGMYGATVFYSVMDSDGTDHVVRGGNIVIQGANKAGTSVCTIASARDIETEDGSAIANAAGAFTLTYTWTNVVSTVNCDLKITGISSAGTNTFDVTWTMVLTGNSSAITVTPQ